MLTEEKIQDILDRWNRFEPFRDGWYETDVIPVGEVQRIVCRMLSVILEREKGTNLSIVEVEHYILH